MSVIVPREMEQNRVVIKTKDADSVNRFRRDAPEILSLADAAKFLGVSTRVLSENVEALEIPCRMIGQTRIFSRAALVRWVENPPC